MPGALFAPWRKRRPTRGQTVPTAPAAPATPNTPSPADTATAYYTLLSWVSARATKFDVYLDTVNPPLAIVVPKLQSTSYVPTLLPGTTYYWKIVAFNDGGSATGPVWSFTTPVATAVIVTLAGAVITPYVRFDNASIHDVLGATPNSGDLVLDTAPAGGQAVQVGLGTLDDADLLFGGEVQTPEETYVGTPEASTFYPVSLIDHTFRINKRRPFGTWTEISASVIGRYVVATFAPGFTSNNIQDGLPLISITFDGERDCMSCLRALADAISDSTHVGKAKVDYAKDVHLFLTAEDVDQPDLIDRDHPPLNDPSPIKFRVDHSQLRTRVYGKGHGENLVADVAERETMLPLADAVMFNPSGGQAIAGTIAGGAQSLILTYAGIDIGGGGSLVGPGASPSSAPAGALADGSGIPLGAHDYAVTFVTAAGESIPGPRLTITVGGAVTPPPLAPTLTERSDIGSALSAGTYEIMYTYMTQAWDFITQPPARETLASPSSFLAIGASHTIQADCPASSDSRVVGVALYVKQAGVFTFLTALNTNGASFFFANYTSSVPYTGVDATEPKQVALSALAIGPSGTTSRKVYRTAVGNSQLKLLTTIADNTTTTYLDSSADTSLGANAPATDTSGLQQPSGQVLAGTTSLLLAGTGAFSSGGGWAVPSNVEPIRYTGISGNTLTGIPATGPGSLAATISYNTTVIAAPVLKGVNSYNGVPVALAKGTAVHIWVQRDDLEAQAALGALELDDDGNPTDGIREYTITDERRGEDSLIEACDADLAIFSRPTVAADYYVRDAKSKSGTTVPIALSIISGIFDPAFFDPAFFGNIVADWGEVGDFTIQRVDITFDGPLLNPLFHVQATSVSFTLMDLLRRVAIGS